MTETQSFNEDKRIAFCSIEGFTPLPWSWPRPAPPCSPLPALRWFSHAWRDRSSVKCWRHGRRDRVLIPSEADAAGDERRAVHDVSRGKGW